MTIRLQWNIEGLGEINDRLNELKHFMRRGVVMQAAYETTKEVLLPAIQASVPVDKGALRASLAVREARHLGKTAGADVYARRGKNYPGGYYAHLVEYGHALYWTTRWWKRKIKDVPPTWFMRRHLVISAGPAFNDFARRVRSNLGSVEQGNFQRIRANFLK